MTVPGRVVSKGRIGQGSSFLPTMSGRQQGFLPTQINGCVLWLRADKGISIGTGVSAWADQSGTGDANKNLTQATGGNQPTYNPANPNYNGLPTLGFLAANTSHMRSGVWATAPTQPITWIIACDQNSGLAQYILDGLTNNTMGMAFRPDLTSFELDAGTGFSTASNTYAPGPLIWAGVFNSTTSPLYINNSQVALANGSAGSGPATGLNIGCAGAGSANPFTGNIAEVIGYNGVLTASQRQAVFLYLGARYNIATS